MVNLKKLAIFFKMCHPWHSSFKLPLNNFYHFFDVPKAWRATLNPSSSSSLVVVDSFPVPCRLACVTPLLRHSTSKMNVASMMGRTASPRHSCPRSKSSAFSLTTASSAGPSGSLFSKLTRSDSWFESFTYNVKQGGQQCYTVFILGRNMFRTSVKAVLALLKLLS